MHLRALVDHLVQAHDVRVPEVGQSIDLAVDRVLGFRVFQVFLFVGLDRNHRFCLFVYGAAHDSKSTLSNLEAYLKVFQIEGLISGLFSLHVNKVNEFADADIVARLASALGRFHGWSPGDILSGYQISGLISV